MSIESFARQFRLSTRREQGSDVVVVPGRVHPRLDGVRCERQLYVDGDELCLLVVDGQVRLPATWRALGARKLWLGDISADSAGRRVQDVRAWGIPMAHAREAIRLVRAKPRRVMSEAQRAHAAQALAKAHPGRWDGS